MIRYENRHFWRSVPSGANMDFVASGPQQAVTEVLCTGPVTIRAVSVSDDGDVGDPFLVGVAQAGSTPVRVRHMTGLTLIFEFAKGTECWVYDDREDHQAVAPVGVSFTVFEKPGHLFDDPMQVIIHRDNVRKALERQQQRGNPQPDRVEELMAQMDRLNKRLEAAEAKNAQAPEPEPQPRAED